jgi:hypothetical protein
MTDPRLWRASVVAMLATTLWVGAWGMDRLLARSRYDASLDVSPRLASACQDELQRRLPPGPIVRIAEYRVQSLGRTGMRLLSQFEGRGNGPTPFSCDLSATAGSWEVTEITIVSW